jgi:PPP family 3-phenylpropionic acid transporter
MYPLTHATRLRLFPWLRWLAQARPLIWGVWFYAGFWGMVGAYVGFLNIYFAKTGFSEVMIGLLSSLPSLMMVLLAPVVAAWADRHAWRVPLVFGALLLMGFSLIAMFFARGPVALFIAYLALSVGYSLVLPLGDGLIARMAAHHRLEYGRMRAWGSFSFAICAAAFGWLWSKLGYEPMFWIAGILLIMLAPSVLVFEETPAPPPGERFRYLSILQDRGLLTVMLVALFFGLGLAFTDPFLGLTMQRLGGSPFLIGLLWMCIALPELPTMHYEQTITRRLGNAFSLMLGCIAMMFGYVLMALAHSPILMLLSAPLLGVGFGLLFVGTVRLVDARVSAERISTVQSIRHALTFGITPLIGSPIGGALYERLGQGFYLSTSICLLIALLIVWRGRREVR